MNGKQKTWEGYNENSQFCKWTLAIQVEYTTNLL